MGDGSQLADGRQNFASHLVDEGDRVLSRHAWPVRAEHHRVGTGARAQVGQLRETVGRSAVDHVSSRERTEIVAALDLLFQESRPSSGQSLTHLS